MSAPVEIPFAYRSVFIRSRWSVEERLLLTDGTRVRVAGQTKLLRDVYPRAHEIRVWMSDEGDRECVAT